MYFGCHDGLACSVTGLIVEGNHIRGVTAASPQVGYGVQVKLNSAAIIRDNVILETKGPGIMVYGSGDLVTVSLVERNFVSGSRTSSGIVVGGGPVVIRNNVSGWNVEAGVSLENYARRRLLRAIVVVHNSVYANQEGGIMAPDQGPVEATIHNNAIHARAGTLPLPPQRPGLRMTGNVDCSWAPCFAMPMRSTSPPSRGRFLSEGAWLRRSPSFPAMISSGPAAGLHRPSAPWISRPGRSAWGSSRRRKDCTWESRL
jgi:hypothetical protein